MHFFSDFLMFEKAVATASKNAIREFNIPLNRTMVDAEYEQHVVNLDANTAEPTNLRLRGMLSGFEKISAVF